MSRVHKNDVPLAERLLWSIPELAALRGCSAWVLYNRSGLPKDPDVNEGTIRLPGGVNVPCFRDVSSKRWLVYRHQYEQAVARLDDAFERAIAEATQPKMDGQCRLTGLVATE